MRLDKMEIDELKQIWKGFKAYALDNCIDLVVEDDYGVWWDCYVAGYKRCDDLMNETIYPVEYNSKIMLRQLQQAQNEE